MCDQSFSARNQDFRAFAIDIYCCLSHPWFLRLPFRQNCLCYRFIEQDVHCFLSCHDALLNQRAIERDGRADGRHVVSWGIKFVHRRLIPGCAGRNDRPPLYKLTTIQPLATMDREKKIRFEGRPYQHHPHLGLYGRSGTPHLQEVAA